MNLNFFEACSLFYHAGCFLDAKPRNTALGMLPKAMKTQEHRPSKPLNPHAPNPKPFNLQPYATLIPKP